MLRGKSGITVNHSPGWRLKRATLLHAITDLDTSHAYIYMCVCMYIHIYVCMYAQCAFQAAQCPRQQHESTWKPTHDDYNIKPRKPHPYAALLKVSLKSDTANPKRLKHVTVSPVPYNSECLYPAANPCTESQHCHRECNMLCLRPEASSPSCVRLIRTLPTSYS